MVSAGVYLGEKERLHLIPDKTKVNAKLYLETLLPDGTCSRLQICFAIWLQSNTCYFVVFLSQ